ncbi:MAG: FG-GAP repeat domain-containing protein, partial [Myxococcales bacterium]
MKAYAMELGITPPLTAQETMELIFLNVDDIDVPESKVDPTKYPSWEGWDPYFGYGRNNVFKSLQALKDGRIPPEVDVIEPKWFETVEPSKPLVVRASLAAQRAPGGFDWTVEIAKGIEAKESDFRKVAEGKGKDAMLGAELTKLDLNGLFEDPTRPPSDPHDFAVQLRVRAVAHYGGTVGDVPGEFRKTFFVHKDPTLLPGYPRYLGASGEGSPRLIDLNGDGRDELVLATSDGLVHAWTATGDELPGFPVRSRPRRWYAAHAELPAYKSKAIPTDYLQPFENTIAVGDLDGDGKLDIVASSFDGELYAWDATGVLKQGFPVAIPDTGFPCFQETITGCRPTGELELPPKNGKRVREIRELQRGYFASPVLYDLDGDGKLEIIQAGLDGLLHVYRADGSPQKGFPIALADPEGGLLDDKGNILLTRARIIGTPAVG